jgi:hypothetical protein
MDTNKQIVSIPYVIHSYPAFFIPLRLSGDFKMGLI